MTALVINRMIGNGIRIELDDELSMGTGPAVAQLASEARTIRKTMSEDQVQN